VSGARRPSRRRWWLIALAGSIAACSSALIAHWSDHLSEPVLQVTLLNWTTLPYIAAGAIASWRRPDSRFGPLMVAAGFVMFLSSLQWTNGGVPFTLGMAFDLLPAAILLQLFLAFPSGRLERRVERVVVATAYAAALGLQLSKMLLWDLDGRNVLALVDEPGAAFTLEDIELGSLSVLSLAGVAVLLIRTRRLPYPLRPRVAMLVNAFALVLVMLAVLLVAGAFGWPAFETIRRITFVGIGIAPVAFLLGLVSARLSSSTLGDLLVQLRTHPARAGVREALSNALRDPSLTLAYWLAEFGCWVDANGQPVELPDEDTDLTTTLIDRDGEPMAALLHDPSLADEPELLDAASAAAAIAVENERLHAELRARLDELHGSRQRVIDAAQLERQRLERDLHDGAQQRLIALSRTAFIRRLSAGTVWRWHSSRWWRGHRFRCGSPSSWMAACRSGWRWRRTTWCRRAWQTSGSTRVRALPACRLRDPLGSSWSRWSTMGWGAPTPSGEPACGASPTGWRHWGGGSGYGRLAARAHG